MAFFILMDPKLLALLQQSQGGQDQENPQEQSMPGDSGEDAGFSIGNGQFDQNPFSHILADMQNQPQGQPAAQAPQPSPAPQGGQNVPGADKNLPQDQTQPGVVTGNTKHLLGAIQSIQQYITASSDRDEILIGRNIIRLLNQLIEKDQATEQNAL